MGRKYRGGNWEGICRKKASGGQIYVYRRIGGYDQETHKTYTIKTELLGIEDPETGELRQTRPRKKPVKKAAVPEQPAPGAMPAAEKAAPKEEKRVEHRAERPRRGSTDILKWAGEASGIREALDASFSEEDSRKLQAVSWYTVVTDGMSMPGLYLWQVNHETPYRWGVSENCYSRLWQDVGENEDGRKAFMRERAKKLSVNPSIAFESRKISTYSPDRDEAEYGFGNDREGLPSSKIITLYSLKDHQPVASENIPGNIPDILLMDNAIKMMDIFDVNKSIIVADNEYCSEKNIAWLCMRHMKFLFHAGNRNGKIKELIDENRENLESAETIIDDACNLHGKSILIEKELSLQRQRTRGTKNAGEVDTFIRRLYVHLYFDSEKKEIETKNLMYKIDQVVKAIFQNKENEKNEKIRKFIDRYLIINKNNKFTIRYNFEEIKNELKYSGYFALISNKAMDAYEAIHLYRDRNRIENTYTIDRENFSERRPGVWNTDLLRGKHFSLFLSLCYYEFISCRIEELKKELLKKENKSKKEIELDNQLYKWVNGNSVSEILRWFDCLEEVVISGDPYAARFSDESRKRDRRFMEKLGVWKPAETAPSNGCDGRTEDFAGRQ